ncbi:hypothetical protein D3C78_1423160 [compost metagenome]
MSTDEGISHKTNNNNRRGKMCSRSTIVCITLNAKVTSKMSILSKDNAMPLKSPSINSIPPIHSEILVA